MAKTLKTKIEEFISQQGNQSGLAGLDEILNTIVDAVDNAVKALAPAYDATSTYAKDAIVTHDGALKKAKAAIETAEAWNPEHWEDTTLAANL